MGQLCSAGKLHEERQIVMKSFKGEVKRKPHIDFGETSAVPEIHVMDDGPEITQREEEKEGNVHVIIEGVAVPEVMKED